MDIEKKRRVVDYLNMAFTQKWYYEVNGDGGINILSGKYGDVLCTISDELLGGLYETGKAFTILETERLKLSAAYSGKVSILLESVHAGCIQVVEEDGEPDELA